MLIEPDSITYYSTTRLTNAEIADLAAGIACLGGTKTLIFKLYQECQIAHLNLIVAEITPHRLVAGIAADLTIGADRQLDIGVVLRIIPPEGADGPVRHNAPLLIVRVVRGVVIWVVRSIG